MSNQGDLRLRLMTLLALYELLPYSISNPPHGSPPATLEEAIGSEAVRLCLDAMARNNPNIQAELANIMVC